MIFNSVVASQSGGGQTETVTLNNQFGNVYITVLQDGDLIPVYVGRNQTVQIPKDSIISVFAGGLDSPSFNPDSAHEVIGTVVLGSLSFVAYRIHENITMSIGGGIG